MITSPQAHESTIVAFPQRSIPKGIEYKEGKGVFQRVSNPRKAGRINKFNTIARSINHRR
jgi:hypothetical protein